MQMTPSSKKSPENSRLRPVVVMASICLFALLVVQAQTGCDAGSDTKLSAEPRAQASSRPVPAAAAVPSAATVPSALATAASSIAKEASPSKAAGKLRKHKAKSVPTFFPASKAGPLPMPMPNAPQAPPAGQGSNEQ